MPPVPAALLGCYVEDRRPERVPASAWAASAWPLLRRRPEASRPDGLSVGARWTEELFPRVVGEAPQLVGREQLSLYSYRHALATWVDVRYGRAMTRRILGHTSRAPVTDQYLHVDEDTVREAIAAYERELLGES